VSSSDLTCRDAVEVVTDYLERTLSAEDRVRFEQHLLVCAACSRYVDQHRVITRLAQELAIDELGGRRDELLAVLAHVGGEPT
jgi:hypothetical protein